MPRLSRILVPVDFSPPSRAAFEYAIFLAERFGARVDVIHVCRTDSVPEEVPATRLGIPGGIGPAVREHAERELAELLRSHRHATQVPIEAHVVFGQPARVLRQRAVEGWYDLIVMGATGRSALSRLVSGSVAQALVRSAPCPVVTIQSPQQVGLDLEPAESDARR